MEHNLIKSKMDIKFIHYCNDCPLRLNNKHNKINLGKGFTFTKTMIVVPYHKINDANNTTYDLIDIVEKAYNKITNGNLTDNYYITALPKCYDISLKDYDIIESASINCVKILINELITICANVENLVLCGIKEEIIEHYLKINTITISHPYTYNNNPDKFEKELKNALNL